MADLDEREKDDMKRAIELSLQESHASAPTVEQAVITLDSDDETTTDGSPEPVEQPTASQSTSAAPTPASGMLGLDRKAMEQERLSRLKRKASISPPPLTRKAVKVDRPQQEPHNTLHPLSGNGTNPPLPHPQSPPQHRLSGNYPLSPPLPFLSLGATKNGFWDPQAQLSDKPKLPFVNGAIKKTWAFGHPRDGHDIKFEEVLQKNDLQLAVLSSFQWDIDWLLAKISTSRSQVVLVMQADTEDVRTQYRRETASMKNLRLCFPSMEGQINCMHSKLMLLSYPTHLRVVVPTANLVPYDWGETGHMENSIFLIDLPRISSGNTTVPDEGMTLFARDLIYFLRAQSLDPSIVSSLSNFDFTATQNLAFVHTIGGAHSGDDEPWRRTGYPSLGRSISHL
ncbi:MAG: hypothetical protein Q9218_007074, partial [Villophora microphyllina]